MSDFDAKRAAEILDAEGGPEKANLELVGWLYPIFTKAQNEATLALIRTHLNNRVSETAGAVRPSILLWMSRYSGMAPPSANLCGSRTLGRPAGRMASGPKASLSKRCRATCNGKV